MIIAVFVWFLGLFGVAPTPADLERMVDESHLRGHHLSIDFNGFRGDVTRKPGVGLGYEYIADRHYHGVSFEAFGMMLGRPSKVDESYFVGAGVGYFPIRLIKIFVQAGPMFQVNSDEVLIHGRVGLGIRFPFFAIQVMPFATVGTTTAGTAPDGTATPSEFVWSIGARLQY